MAINVVVGVQYNGGFLPDIIILLTLCYYHQGIRLKAIIRFCLRRLCSHLTRRFDKFSPCLGDAQKV